MAPAIRAVLFGIATAVVVPSCGPKGGEDTDESTSVNTFVPFAKDFQGFRTWKSFSLSTVVAPPASNVNVHLGGTRTLYVKTLPPPGSTAFPVGTLIVKEVVGAGENKLFAMTKRGGDYNSNGAKGWEWLELTDTTEGAASILWRGVDPPPGLAYGGDPSTRCSVCHEGAKANDYVFSTALQLTAF